MGWTRWISVYTLILAAFAFWIIPDKSLLYIGICVGVGVLSLIVMRYYPPIEDEKPYKPFPWPKPFKKAWVAFGWAGLVFMVGLIIFATVMDIRSWFN